MAVKCSCGYVNHNPDARSCELCHAKLKPGGASSAGSSKLPDSNDDLAKAAADVGDEEEEASKAKPSTSKQAGAKPATKSSGTKQEAVAAKASATAGARTGGSGLDMLLFALSFPVSFPAALFVLLKSNDWQSVPVSVWIGQGMLALTAALGATLSVGPGSAPWHSAVLPVIMLSALAGAALLVRIGETGAGWGSAGLLIAGCCMGSGAVLASRAGPIFEGHREPVRAIDVSRDGKRLATVADDGDLRLFEVESRELVQTTAAHVPVATSVRFDATGKLAITAGADGFATIWDLGVADGAPKRIDAHRGGVTDVDIATPPGSTEPRIVTSGVDGTVRLWARDGSPTGSLTRHKGAVTTAAFSPDGSRVASGGTDGVVYVWTPGSGAKALEKHKGPVICVAWSPDGNRLVTGGEDRTIWVWDLSDKQAPPNVLAGGAGVRAIIVLPKGKLMVSAHDSRALILWDLDKGASLGEVELPAVASSLATSPDGSQLFAATGRVVRVLDVHDAFPAP